MAEEKKKLTKEEKEKATKAVVAAIEKEAKKSGATILPKKDAKKKEEKKEEMKPITSDAWKTLRFVLMTEKCVRMIDAENVLVFITTRKSGKRDIQNAFETAFGSKVRNVRTVIDQAGRKKAYIRLKEEGAAGDIAIRLGII